jgi:cytochrome c553
MQARISGSRGILDIAVRRTALVTAAVVLFVLSSNSAGYAAQTSPAGADIEAGKALVAKVCANCHGQDGLSRTKGTPHLAGQSETYFKTSLAAYKDGRRKDKTMVDVTASLSEADIANIAAYYSSLPSFNKTLPAPADVGAEPAESKDPFAAIREATAACAGCHGEDGNSQIPGTPGLAGQHTVYQIAALKAYKDGTRPDETMKAMVAELSDATIEDMAYFYAAMAPKRTENLGSGDPFAGVGATASCVGCHALDGNNTDPKIPRLAGLDATYLSAAARAYKKGARAHSAMQDAMAEFRESDIDDMAAYYASREPKALTVRKPLTTGQWVERCDRCHGTNGNSSNPTFPILAGQDETYLVNALKNYHLSVRESEFMFAISFPMTESDIHKLARYYTRQRAGK